MRFIYMFLFIFITFSCDYPDIDSVPNFEDTQLNEEEAIDLCNLTNTDKIELEKCLEGLDYKQ